MQVAEDVRTVMLSDDSQDNIGERSRAPLLAVPLATCWLHAWMGRTG